MIKWILGGAIALGAASVAAPMISNGFNSDNEAQRLVEATDKTNNQAGDLGDSYTRIVPITNEKGEPIGPEQQVEQKEEVDQRYDQYTSDAEHEVRDAIIFLNELLAETGPPPQTEYLSAVNQLQSAWAPRYDKAAQDYKVFAYRIHHAEKMAEGYFEVQARLTARLTNSDIRGRAEHNDILERNAYLEWRTQAHKTLNRARLIKQDLDDMNVIITKQVLSANFAALYQDFQELPQSMVALHADIAEFQKQSEEINATFGPAASQ